MIDHLLTSEEYPEGLQVPGCGLEFSVVVQGPFKDQLAINKKLGLLVQLDSTAGRVDTRLLAVAMEKIKLDTDRPPHLFRDAESAYELMPAGDACVISKGGRCAEEFFLPDKDYVLVHNRISERLYVNYADLPQTVVNLLTQGSLKLRIVDHIDRPVGPQEVAVQVVPNGVSVISRKKCSKPRILVRTGPDFSYERRGGGRIMVLDRTGPDQWRLIRPDDRKYSDVGLEGPSWYQTSDQDPFALVLQETLSNHNVPPIVLPTPKGRVSFQRDDRHQVVRFVSGRNYYATPPIRPKFQDFSRGWELQDGSGSVTAAALEHSNKIPVFSNVKLGRAAASENNVQEGDLLLVSSGERSMVVTAGTHAGRPFYMQSYQRALICDRFTCSAILKIYPVKNKSVTVSHLVLSSDGTLRLKINGAWRSVYISARNTPGMVKIDLGSWPHRLRVSKHDRPEICLEKINLKKHYLNAKPGGPSGSAMVQEIASPQSSV